MGSIIWLLAFGCLNVCLGECATTFGSGISFCKCIDARSLGVTILFCNRTRLSYWACLSLYSPELCNASHVKPSGEVQHIHLKYSSATKHRLTIWSRSPKLEIIKNIGSSPLFCQHWTRVFHERAPKKEYLVRSGPWEVSSGFLLSVV